MFQNRVASILHGTYQDFVEMAELDGKMSRTEHIQEDTDNENGFVEAAPGTRASKH
jgi:hypothetical protein